MKRIIIALALACAFAPQVLPAAATERRPISPPKPEPDHGPTLPPDPWTPI